MHRKNTHRASTPMAAISQSVREVNAGSSSALDRMAVGAGNGKHRSDALMRYGFGRWLRGMGQFWCAFYADQLGPDAAPCLLAQHLTSEDAFRVIFELPRVSRLHVTPACQALVQILLIKIELGGQRLAFGCGNFFKHATKSSTMLVIVKTPGLAIRVCPEKYFTLLSSFVLDNI